MAVSAFQLARGRSRSRVRATRSHRAVPRACSRSMSRSPRDSRSCRSWRPGVAVLVPPAYRDAALPGALLAFAEVAHGAPHRGAGREPRIAQRRSRVDLGGRGRGHARARDCARAAARAVRRRARDVRRIRTVDRAAVRVGAADPPDPVPGPARACALPDRARLPRRGHGGDARRAPAARIDRSARRDPRRVPRCCIVARAPPAASRHRAGYAAGRCHAADRAARGRTTCAGSQGSCARRRGRAGRQPTAAHGRPHGGAAGTRRFPARARNRRALVVGGSVCADETFSGPAVRARRRQARPPTRLASRFATRDPRPLAGRASTDAILGRYWIVFNGEIYNYIELRNLRRADTRSDRQRHRGSCSRPMRRGARTCCRS
jgi:hypothetical protein